jgi:gluconokinase
VRSGPIALGVDLGTGSVRAFCYDAAGQRIGGVRLPYAWRVDTDGAAEADADALVALVYSAIDGALVAVPRNAEIVAVGFAALWHTLLGLDERGRPLTPVTAWNDTRATSAARRLRQRLDARAVHARTGAMLHPSYPSARLLWLKETQAAVFRRAQRWLSLPEYLWLRLTGEARVDVSIAAGSGLLEQRSMRWDAELLDTAGIDERQLGVVTWGSAASVPGDAVACCERWPRLRAARWRMPVGDGACANVGSGAHDAGSVALSVGTSAALRVVVPTAQYETTPAGLWLYRLAPETALLGGAISNGGVVRSWLRATLQLPADDAALDALLEARPAAAHGVTMLPFLGGERSPDWPLDATALVAGLRLGTSPLDVLQAGMEAVAYRLALLRATMAAAAPDARRIVASGGAVRQSAYWPQLLADTFGEPLLLSSEAETTSRGAALLALLAAGTIDSLDAVPAPGSVRIEPRAGHHAAHRAALARHLEVQRRYAAQD